MMGFNGTLFCYGQTGSGKTYSKLPPSQCLEDQDKLTYIAMMVASPCSSKLSS